MDYKGLIEQLRKHHQSWAAYSDLELAHALEDAATAIETLLAERTDSRLTPKNALMLIFT